MSSHRTGQYFRDIAVGTFGADAVAAIDKFLEQKRLSWEWVAHRARQTDEVEPSDAYVIGFLDGVGAASRQPGDDV